MKRTLILTVLVFGCDAGLQGVPLEIPQNTQSGNQLVSVNDAPRPTAKVAGGERLGLQAIPNQNPRGEWLQCASAGRTTDFTGRLYNLVMSIGHSRQDFTGITDAVVSVRGTSAGSGDLPFGGVNQSSSVGLNLWMDGEELFIRYSPVAGSPLNMDTQHLNNFFLEHETSIRLREVAEGHFIGTLENLSLFELPISCWASDRKREFTYNPQTGDCQNEEGKIGFNSSDVFQVRQTKDGQCVDMTTWALNGEDYNYPNLDWDVRGANLNGASIVFANMIGADFRGAKMEDFSYGYTTLQGPIDEFTQVPTDCSSPEPDSIDCTR